MTARSRKSAAGSSERSSGSSARGAKTGAQKDDGKTKWRTPFASRYSKFGRVGEKSADGSFVSHQTFARILMFAGVLVVAFWSSANWHKTEHRAIMAKQSDFLSDKRYQHLMCSPSFRKEILDMSNEKCLPKKCGRFVADDIVTPSEAHALLEIAKKGLAKGGSDGGASILDLHSGALSKGEHFVNLYKVYPDLFDHRDFDTYKKVKEKVKRAIADHFQVSFDHMYLSHPTFFSRIDSKDAKTLHDEYWHVHVDKETYPNFHFTSLLYLTDFGVDFQGGSFVFVDNTDRINRTIEPRLGRVSAFTSGIENKHHVERVTSGIRYALTMGFTCDKTKEIADPGHHLNR